jgi:hypothetical protein
MRIVPLTLGTLVICVLWAGAPQAQDQARAADPIITAARDALGGAQKIAALKSFTVTGRTRQVQGDNLVPIEFEIACEWPDKCYRKDEIPARESAPTTIGFNGNELIQLPVPAPPPAPAAGAPGGAGRPGGPAPNPDAQRLARANTAKQDITRILLGMVIGSVDAFPLTFTYAGEAEAPQGKADMLDVKGPNNFAARLFIFRETHLPIMLTWQAPAAAARGARPGGPAAGAPAAAGGPPAAPPQVENRIYFADYRDADGFKFPYRLRRAVGADTIEETTFDRFRVNVKIDPKKFEVRK